MGKLNQHSDTWSTVEAWAKARRDNSVAQLIEGTNRDDKLRGIIEAMDDLLALPDKAEQRPVEPTDYLLSS